VKGGVGRPNDADSRPSADNARANDGDPRSSAADAFERCISVGGLAVFPADTVYGLGCDPDHRFAVERLYLLKRRPLEKPSAVMFFDLEMAFEAIPELGERTREAMRRLLPGGVTLLVGNPAGRFPLACGADRATLGLRVPDIPRLAGVRSPILQSSANRAGGRDPRTIAEIPELIRAAADLVIDGGELPGTPSTVLDMRAYEDSGEWKVVREGLVGTEELKHALRWQYHFDPSTYLSMMRDEIPFFEQLQEELVSVSGSGASRILELGTGTGETTRGLLVRHPDATVVGIDASGEMLAVARRELPPERVELRVGRIEDELPEGPFDLVATALAVHHLDAAEKAQLFRRIRELLAPAGRFVLADVVVPEDPAEARTPLTPGLDRPSSVADQLAWMRDAGLEARVSWRHGDLAVLIGEPRP
jgi:tRNA threonylcarbamoyl adenosine modification protein (Sua5/YciO/YrdC/YwlC family)